MTGPWEGTVQAVPPQVALVGQSRNLKKKKKKKKGWLKAAYIQVQLQGQELMY